MEVRAEEVEVEEPAEKRRRRRLKPGLAPGLVAASSRAPKFSVEAGPSSWPRGGCGGPYLSRTVAAEEEEEEEELRWVRARSRRVGLRRVPPEKPPHTFVGKTPPPPLQGANRSSG